MITQSVTVRVPQEPDRNGAMLVQTATEFDSRIHVTYLNKTVNAKSIMGVMTLPLSDGDVVTITAEGPDEEAAARAIEAFLSE